MGLTVKQMKKALNGLPDDAKIAVGCGMLGVFLVEHIEMDTIQCDDGIYRDLAVIK